MTKKIYAAIALAGPLVLLSACVASTPPVEVTRFNVAERQGELARGSIRIMPGFNVDGQSLEYRSYAIAVQRELAALGYDAELAGPHQQDYKTVQQARLSFERFPYEEGGRSGGPVSVGVGGHTGSYSSGVGLGIGINLGGGRKERIVTRLAVTITDADQVSLWEGRAEMTAKAGSAVAETQLSADKLASALFQDFPGHSGETITVE